MTDIGGESVTMNVGYPFAIRTSVLGTRKWKGGVISSQFSGIGVTGTDIAGLKLLELLRGTKLVGHSCVGGSGEFRVELRR